MLDTHFTKNSIVPLKTYAMHYYRLYKSFAK